MVQHRQAVQRHREVNVPLGRTVRDITGVTVHHRQSERLHQKSECTAWTNGTAPSCEWWFGTDERYSTFLLRAKVQHRPTAQRFGGTVALLWTVTVQHLWTIWHCSSHSGALQRYNASARGTVCSGCLVYPALSQEPSKPSHTHRCAHRFHRGTPAYPHFLCSSHQYSLIISGGYSNDSCY